MIRRERGWKGMGREAERWSLLPRLDEDATDLYAEANPMRGRPPFRRPALPCGHHQRTHRPEAPHVRWTSKGHAMDWGINPNFKIPILGGVKNFIPAPSLQSISLFRYKTKNNLCGMPYLVTTFEGG